MHYIDGKGHKLELRRNRNYLTPNHATSYSWPWDENAYTVMYTRTQTRTRIYIHMKSDFKTPDASRRQYLVKKTNVKANYDKNIPATVSSLSKVEKTNMTQKYIG